MLRGASAIGLTWQSMLVKDKQATSVVTITRLLS